MVSKEAYNGYNPEIMIINKVKFPWTTIVLALDMTMKREIKALEAKKNKARKIIKRVLDMNHTSVFEHISYTFLIVGVSRSFMSQITRHRMGSFTCSSQHYQNYEDYPFIIAEKWKDNPFVRQSVGYARENYLLLRKAGCPKEEARQVLPGGMGVNIMWTVNARSLINFLNLRLCHRNCEEIRIFAEKLHRILKEHFPQLFEYIGTDCVMSKCTQGKMKCLFHRSEGGPLNDFKR